MSSVSLVVGEGEICGVVGETGAGKSLTLWSIIQLLGEGVSIAGGSIRFRGEELVGRPKAAARLRGDDIGVIVQNPRMSLHPMRRVGSQIGDLIRQHNNVSRREARALAIQALGEVGIGDARRAASSFPHELSGGMCQRVVVAMATAGRPALLLADEPTTGLDLTIQKQVLDLLTSRVRTTGSSILLVTHDLTVAASYCDSVVVMRDGGVVEAGSVESVFASPMSDYTRQLIEASAVQGFSSRDSELTGEESP